MKECPLYLEDALHDTTVMYREKESSKYRLRDGLGEPIKSILAL